MPQTAEKGKSILTQKYGPLPMYGWFAILAVGVYWYRKTHPTATTQTGTNAGVPYPTASDNTTPLYFPQGGNNMQGPGSVPATVGTTGIASDGGSTPSGTPTPTTPSPPSPPATVPYTPGMTFTPGGVSQVTGTPVPLGANPATGGVPAGANPNLPYSNPPNINVYSLPNGQTTSDLSAAYTAQLAAMGLKPGHV